MTTFHNDEKLKKRLVESYKAHIAADTLIKGDYFDENDGTFMGCHMGCVVNEMGGEDEHSYEALTGLPMEYARLAERYHERLPHPLNQEIGLAMLDACPVGVDLTIVFSKFKLWLLMDEEFGSLQYCDEQGKAATEVVAALHRRFIDGGSVSEEDWAAARAASDAAMDAASDAAMDAAMDAAWAAARGAARDAARDAAWAAAWAAASEADRYAARAAHMEASARKFIELLRGVENA